MITPGLSVVLLIAVIVHGIVSVVTLKRAIRLCEEIRDARDMYRNERDEWRRLAIAAGVPSNAVEVEP